MEQTDGIAKLTICKFYQYFELERQLHAYEIIPSLTTVMMYLEIPPRPLLNYDFVDLRYFGTNRWLTPPVIVEGSMTDSGPSEYRLPAKVIRLESG